MTMLGLNLGKRGMEDMEVCCFKELFYTKRTALWILFHTLI